MLTCIFQDREHHYDNTKATGDFRDIIRQQEGGVVFPELDCIFSSIVFGDQALLQDLIPVNQLIIRGERNILY